MPMLYGGVAYPSVRSCCRELSVDYAALQRLRRKYLRAQRSPAVAVDWLLGVEPIPLGEPVTMAHRRDTGLSRRRAARHYQRIKRIRAQERARRNRELLESLETASGPPVP